MPKKTDPGFRFHASNLRRQRAADETNAILNVIRQKRARGSESEGHGVAVVECPLPLKAANQSSRFNVPLQTAATFPAMSRRFGVFALSRGLFRSYVGLCAFSKAAPVALREVGNTKPLQIFNPLKILCLEERMPGVLMASKDMYPKGSAMNMNIPVAFVKLVV